ncbi:MAG: hypothetical protein LBM28_03265 [Oscillospiraceae bacterium]|jgi:hypothetical protein|nr:hypothetical protein [Oscillospiraceae bacterium]
MLQIISTAIPARPADIGEALRLMGEGWGAIFVVILIIMFTIFMLNRLYVFSIYLSKRFFRGKSK